MVKLAEFSRTATFTWSHDKIPLLVSGTVSGTVDANFSTDSSLELWSLLAADSEKPVASLQVDSKFNDLDWSHNNKVIAGALDNGVLELYSVNDANDTITSAGKFSNHSSSVKTVKFNAKQDNVLVSGGHNGEIFIWDMNKCTESPSNYTPLTPGQSMSSVEEVNSLAWNQSLAHVFASAGSSNFASIWDLKAKKEVIHLSYTSPNSGIKQQLSVVEWHPKNSTRVATATGSDNDPSILVWDLRNANTPLQTLNQGHQKGILSLDWCHQDENLLLSSGRDNNVLLWNPETAEQLSQFPSRGNWCFKTKFAPEAPDLFACASFDNKIEVQTLQNLTNTLDEQESETKQQESETDFWNNVSQEESKEKPTVFHLQAPSWYGQPSPAAHWAFGGKLVRITPDGKGVAITNPKISGLESNTALSEALKSKDFKPLINQRLVKVIDDVNEEDWNLLEKLSMDGTDEYLKEALAFDNNESDAQDEVENEEEDDGEEFFQQIETNFHPEGTFTLADNIEQTISKNLVSGNIKSAVKNSLENDLLMEAMIIALDSNNERLKESVKNTYFTKYGSKSSLSRILYSVSKKEVDDLVENLDVSQWKFICKAILNLYPNDVTQKNEMLIKLGDRLKENGHRQDSLTLYLAAGSLDKVASIWLAEFSELEDKLKEDNKTIYEVHSECLTEFIEKFTVFSTFINGNSTITNEQLISKFLEFINITTSTGNFELATEFLNTLPSDNEEVKTEKARVLIASGKSLSQQNATTASATRKAKYSNGKTNKNVPVLPTPGVHSATSPSGMQAPFYGMTPGASSGALPPKPYVPTIASNGPVQTDSKYAPPHQPSMSPSFGNKTNSSTRLNTYAPPPNPYATVVAPASISAATSTTSIPQNAFAPIQPGMPIMADFNPQSSSMSSQPPMNVVSGQTPHLNRKANDGWNDLPLKVKERPSRAKAVSVAPPNILSTPAPLNGIPVHSTNTMPPPPLSRAPSSVSMVSPPPPHKTSRVPSLVATSESPRASVSNPYAPSQPVQQPPMVTPSLASQNSNFIQQPSSNPYAPPPQPRVATPLTGSVNSAPLPKASNPYAPGTAAQPNGSSFPPTNAYQNNHSAASITSPPTTSNKAPTGPPPISMKKRSNKLTSIDQKPPQAVPYPPPLSSSASPLQTSQPPTLASQANSSTENIGHEVPVDQQPIVDFLKEELARVTPLTPKEYSKQLKDCDKRLKILFYHLERQDLLTQPTIDRLHDLVALMKEKKYKESMVIHADIATNHAQEGGNWLTGVKRLIGIAEATLN
ncbi:sec31p [Saccharomyces arboricola H-6]|uniref:Protein transport protein SEC31 n=1 Tax=Saccharomyces arboricola (strain H-6 / AS 2.3317 / CBS 10644) TaxID=1160507 RepID=J8PQM3_SACAR|nr:sec31p [Saccharomyces arboricola H-6]